MWIVVVRVSAAAGWITFVRDNLGHFSSEFPIKDNKELLLLIAYEELFVYLHRSVRHNTTSHSVGAKVPAREGSPSGKLVLRRLGQTFSATIACGAFLVFYDSKCCDAVLNLHGRLHANPYHSPIWGRQIDHRKTEEHRGIHPVLYYCAWFQNAQKSRLGCDFSMGLVSRTT